MRSKGAIRDILGKTALVARVDAFRPLFFNYSQVYPPDPPSP